MRDDSIPLPINGTMITEKTSCECDGDAPWYPPGWSLRTLVLTSDFGSRPQQNALPSRRLPTYKSELLRYTQGIFNNVREAQNIFREVHVIDGNVRVTRPDTPLRKNMRAHTTMLGSRFGVRLISWVAALLY